LFTPVEKLKILGHASCDAWGSSQEVKSTGNLLRAIRFEQRGSTPRQMSEEIQKIGSKRVRI
jgi:hypothetical protein